MERIPPFARPRLAAYCDLLSRRCEPIAIYVHGSIALDAFDPRTSDLDVLAVVRRTARVSAPRIDAQLVTIDEVGSVSATARKLIAERGIAILGSLDRVPAPSSEELRAEMRYNLDVYWRRRAKRIDLHLFDEGVAFAVQTLPRILRTLETGEIISKPAAVAWLREHSPQWRWLTEPVSIADRPRRALETRRFILSMIDQSNSKIASAL